MSDDLTMERLNFEAALAEVRAQIVQRTLEDIAATEAAFPVEDDLNEIGRAYAARLRSVKSECELEARKAREDAA
jgi:hypothetical protein